MQQIKNLLSRLQSKHFEVRYSPEYQPDDGKIHVLFLSPFINGVALYRTILPAMYLNSTPTHAAIINGFYSWNYSAQFRERELQVDDRLLRWANYVVMPTAMSDIRPMITHMISKNPHLKFVMDIDDNPHVMHAQHPSFNQYTREMKLNLVRNLSLCEFFTTTTDRLADYYLKRISENYPTSKTEVAIVPNLMSKYLVSDPTMPKAKFDKVRIGMIVTAQHFVNVYPFRDILQQVQAKYGDRIELINFGWDGKYKMKDAFKNLKITCHPATPFTDYFEEINKQCFDIGLIPLKNIPEFNQYKSYQRWLEFTSASVPVIAGDSSVYESVMIENTTGIIAKSSEDWISNIGLLIEHPEERLRIASNAKDFVDKFLSWDTGNHVENLQTIFQ